MIPAQLAKDLSLERGTNFMRLLSLVIFLLLALAGHQGLAQVDSSEVNEGYSASRYYREKAYTLLVGGHLQYVKDEQDRDHTRRLIEAGLHQTITTSYAVLTHGPSVEVAPGRNALAGVKYGAWSNVYFFALGLNALYYTDFAEGAFRLRPEFGLGVNRVKLTWGYNIPLTNKSFQPLQGSSGQLTLNVLFRLKTTGYDGPARH